MQKVSKISYGIKISVHNRYREEYSGEVPDAQGENIHYFVYFIEIENFSDKKLKLLKRYWEIYDFVDGRRIVEGEGVVGVQPLLYPGEKYQYNSACEIRGEMGKMKGKYLFKDIENNDEFWVEIPEFFLVHPILLN